MHTYDPAVGSAHYNNVIKKRVLPGAWERPLVNHRDGQQVRCGEESDAAQTSAHGRGRVCHGRNKSCYYFFILRLCTNANGVRHWHFLLIYNNIIPPPVCHDTRLLHYARSDRVVSVTGMCAPLRPPHSGPICGTSSQGSGWFLMGGPTALKLATSPVVRAHGGCPSSVEAETPRTRHLAS